MKPIVLATDGSPAAEVATTEAIELARATGMPLHVVVVWSTPTIAAFDYAGLTVVRELTEAEKDHAVSVAERTAGRARDAGVSVTADVHEGDPTQQICAAAAACDARMIVVGAHGWSVVKRLMLGSVSARLVHEAPCAVLVVRESERRRTVSGRPTALAGA